MKKLAHRLGSVWIWGSVAILQLLFILWWSRWIIDVRFDRHALTDLYDHSQWVVPQSPRIMADAELYQVGGDVLWRTGEFFRVNPEVPPLGKYLYGAAVNLTGHPYAGSITVFLFSLFLICILCFLLFPLHSRRQAAALSISLLLGNQLYSSQMSQTMLDIPQLCGLLLFMIGLIAYKKTTKQLFLFLSGLGISIFIGTKIGVLAPILLIGGAFILPPKHWKQWLIILATGAAFYLALYLPYFLQGNSIIDWLKTQKWMITFYRSSSVTPALHNVTAVVLTGWHWGWWNETWSAVKEWSVLWPLTIGSLVLGWKQWKSLDHNWRALLVTNSLFLVSFLIFPFWPRYLILILPGSVLFLTQSIRKHPLTSQLTMAAGILLLTVATQLPLAQPIAAHVADRWSAMAYPEIHGTLSEGSQKELPLEAFTTVIAGAEQGIQSEKITAYAELSQKNLWSSQQTGTLYLVRQTPLGLVTHAHPIQLVRERGRWKVLWDWQLVAPYFEPGSHFTVIREDLPYGTVRTSDKVEIIQPSHKEILFVKPDKIKNEEADMKKLELLTGLRGIDMGIKIFVTSYGAPFVKIGPISQDLSQATVEETQKDPSYVWSEEPSYAFIEDLRGVQYAPWLTKFVLENPQLQSLSAGSLMLTLPDESIKILKETAGKKGEDITLSETYEELKLRIERELR